jgi:hypothetical protein
MTANRTILLSVVLAATALAPATALAKHGADDNPAVADDRGGQRADDNPGASGKSGKADRAKTEVRVAGACTANSTSKLKLKRDRGRLKAEFEVDQNANGVTWAVQLRRNGTVAVDTTRTTHAPSGSFSIERRLANGPGPDTVSASATSPSGEVCTASATI